jgi:hypothetical protein
MPLGVTVRSVVLALTFALIGCTGVRSGGLNAVPGTVSDGGGADGPDATSKDGPSVGTPRPFDAGAPDAPPPDAPRSPDAPVPADAAPDLPPSCPPNACGGCKALTARPGETCGSGCGRYKCNGTDEVICEDPRPNGCGGCKALPSAPGVACGACGTYKCDGQEALVCNDPGLNECGGCAALTGRKDAPCGTGGCGRLHCTGKDALTCEGPMANACGGCGMLDGSKDAPCGAGNCGRLHCRGSDALVCEGPMPNACGGCGTLMGTKDAPCGPGGCGRLRCRGNDALVCEGAMPNACGGCMALATPPGGDCGACGRTACEGLDATRCVETTCGGDKPVCLRATCVECTPGAKRCGMTGVETCNRQGTFVLSEACLPGTACQQSATEADCVGVTPFTPMEGAMSSAPSFTWAYRNRVPGAAVCSVLMLDKAGSPADGIGEDAFYVGGADRLTPALDRARYFPHSEVQWSVITVACSDPMATCQACLDSQACATQGVLTHMPCAGTVLTTPVRHLIIDEQPGPPAPTPTPTPPDPPGPRPGPGPRPF